MAITITWGTKVINVPFADLEWVQDNPTVIRKMDINAFRLSLKDLEDDSEGMPHLDTHRHNTEVTLGGLTFARVVEIINGYTVTFEDGQYAVNLYGANSNVADVVNVNQVSVRAFNSAGLISSPAIEYASFNGGVTIDVTSSATGTIYNVGTPENPVNNLADAILIAESRGFNKLYVIGNLTLGATDNVDGYCLCGQGRQITTVTVTSGCSTIGTHYDDVRLEGDLSGDNGSFHRIAFGDVTGVNGTAYESSLVGTVVLSGSGDVSFLHCYSAVPGSGTPEIDMGGSGRGLNLRAYTGGVKLTNKTGVDNVSIDLISGQVQIASTVTTGTIVVRGIGKITLNDGTATVLDYGLVVGETLEDGLLSILSDTEFIKHIEGGKWAIVGTQMIFYKDDNVTEIARFDLTYDGDGNPIMRARV